jgi:hypothetical protein
MIVSAPPVDIASLRSQFTSLAVDLTRTDEKLEYHGSRHNRPTGDWNGELNGLASRLDDARIAFATVRPDATDLIYSLGADVRDLSESAGKLAIMVPHDMTFSGNWGDNLDQSIFDVQRAADMLDAPTPPPLPPVTPPNPGSGVHEDAARAVQLIQQSIEKIRTVPVNDKGDASTKDARIAAFNLNKEAQALLEPHFNGENASITSQLRSADASLEDANWQLAKKPSPDGRFNGVDIPGALRDSETAVGILLQLGD